MNAILVNPNEDVTKTSRHQVVCQDCGKWFTVVGVTIKGGGGERCAQCQASGWGWEGRKKGRTVVARAVKKFIKDPLICPRCEKNYLHEHEEHYYKQCHQCRAKVVHAKANMRMNIYT